MSETTEQDHHLLERYARQASEAAFSELVQRHINLVWSAAFRLTGDSELARDVAQTVFSDLARKAGYFPKAVTIPGWLYRASVMAAQNTLHGLAITSPPTSRLTN
jgi:DNA-directed RNA polymerase specialized sigma24 family protein